MRKTRIKTMGLESWCIILAELLRKEKSFLSYICKKTNITHSNAHLVSILLDEKGYITKIKEGRIVYISLTPKGKKLAEKIMDLMILMREK